MNTELLLPQEVPSINLTMDISSSNMECLIPKGYEDMIETSWSEGNILITCKQPENSYIDTITIPSVLFNNHLHLQSTVPKGFLFFNSSFPDLDYFGVDSNHVLNIRQIIYLILQHRFAVWANYEKQYVDLLNTDFKNLKTFIEYQVPNTYNAKVKVNNSYIILNVIDYSQALGEVINSTQLDEAEWATFMKNVTIDISSETAMSSSNKVVILQNEKYKAVGYEEFEDESGKYFHSIFPPKQNMAARLKTHMLSTGYLLENPDSSVFLSDLKTVKSTNGDLEVKPLDGTLKKAIVVFDHMDKESQRFVAGEIESSLNIAQTLVHLVKTFDVDFLDPSNPLTVNSYHCPNFKKFSIGLDEEREQIFLQNIKEFTVLSVKDSGPNGVTSIKLDLVIRAGNARIISNTGLKGVTKTKPKLGYITIQDPVKTANLSKQVLTPMSSKHSKNEDYSNFGELDDRLMHIPVDLIAGMNAVKAKDNTIAACQAAFAVEYGFYKPRSKMGFEGLLNDKDADEINAAAQSIPEFTFTDEFGESRPVKFGLVYILYTELGDIYCKFKKQSFAFEAGKNILFNYPELYHHIQDEYLDERNVNIALELSKCLYDDKAALNKVETEVPLPVYGVKKIKQLFDIDDLILSRSLLFKSASRLLDEEWNTHGFIINLNKPQFPKIRIPSAKVLNCLVGELKDGSITYHAIIINISKILNNILGNQENGFRPILPFIYDPTHSRNTSYSLYLKSLQGTIFSAEESSEMKIQALIKPQIYGVNMKQVVEHRLPFNTLVIMDDKIYNRFCNIAAGENNPEQIFRTVDENSTFLDMLNQHCPNIYATHSPHLWTSQSFAPIIWDRHTYALYLKEVYDIDIDDYLYTRTNNDIALIHPMLALQAKKDVDGDLICLYAFNDKGQLLLQNFHLPNIVADEIKWINEYIEGEYETTFDLDLTKPSVYRLYITYKSAINSKGEVVHKKFYCQFLLNSSIAKKNIGSATLDIWALTIILQCYQQYCKINNFKYVKKGNVVTTLRTEITEEDLLYLSYVYTLLVQDRVIEAIKHVEEGSASFQMYFLSEMPKGNNFKLISNQLRKDFNIPDVYIKKLINVVAFAHDCKLLKASRNFISIHNKGRFPQDMEPFELWKDFIHDHSYFGQLMTPLFEIRRNIESITIQAKEESSAELEDLFSEIDNLI